MAPADGMTPEPPDRPILDEAPLRMIRALGQAGAPNPLAKVIDIYLDYSPKLIGEIESAIADRNAEALCRAAHSLQSSSASLGALGLAAWCKELETIGRSGTTEGAGAIFEAFHGQFDRVRVALEGEREKVVAAGAA